MTTAPTFERDFYRELLEENPALLARIVAFNRGGAASASPCVRFAEELSKDEPTDVDWADLIARHPDLCALAAERTAPEEKAGDDYWGFAETSERFALIPEDELDRLVRRAAAAVYGAEIAVTVRKDEREALRAKLGDDLLRYAVLRGRWQAGSLAGELKRFCAGLALPDAVERLSHFGRRSSLGGLARRSSRQDGSAFYAAPGGGRGPARRRAARPPRARLSVETH